MEKIAIIGCGITKFEGRKKEPYFNTAFEASKMAVEDACISKGDIENVVLSGYDLSAGRTISSMYVIGSAGAYLKDEIKVADDGIFALALAYLRILSGFEITLVLSYGISSETVPELIANLTLDPLFYRDSGLSEITLCALQSQIYMSKNGIKEEDAAEFVVKNRNSALLNPYAHIRKKVTKKEVLNSEMICFPLRKLEVAPYSDGAVALVLAPERLAKTVKKNYVTIEGISWIQDTYHPGERVKEPATSLKRIVQSAFEKASISVEDLNVIEVSEFTPYHEIMCLEAIFNLEPAQIIKKMKEGDFHLNGKSPVNPSGGMLSSNPDVSTGLARVAEVYLQLTENAGKRQIKNAEFGLVHGKGGLGYQNNCVAILKRND